MEFKALASPRLKICAVVALAAFPAVLSAQDGGQATLQTDPSGGITPLSDLGEGRLAPGVRVRVRTSDVVEVPGLASVKQVAVRGEKRLVCDGQHVIFDDENKTVTVSDASGERVTVPKPLAAFVGQIVSVDDTIMVITLDGRPVRLTLPRSSVTGLDLSLGRKKNRGRGASALRGMGIGIGAGALLGYAAGDDHCTPHGRDFLEQALSCWGAATAREKATIAGTLLGALGGIVGLASGGGETERWESVSAAAPSKIKVGVRPQGRLGLLVSVGF